MKLVKQAADYTIYQKGSGRYAVSGAEGKWVNGEDKVLTGEGLVTLSAPKAAAPDEAAPGENDAVADAGEGTPPARG